MGMDVCGKQPAAPVGEYFRNNAWWWHPLWDYVEHVAPHIAERVPYAHSNGGDGLDARECAELAAVLTAELAAGRTEDYEARYAARINALPDEPCSYCAGTGTRSDADGIESGMVDRSYCNGCEGKGTVRPRDAWYPFLAETSRSSAISSPQAAASKSGEQVRRARCGRSATPWAAAGNLVWRTDSNRPFGGTRRLQRRGFAQGSKGLKPLTGARTPSACARGVISTDRCCIGCHELLAPLPADAAPPN